MISCSLGVKDLNIKDLGIHRLGWRVVWDVFERRVTSRAIWTLDVLWFKKLWVFKLGRLLRVIQWGLFIKSWYSLDNWWSSYWSDQLFPLDLQYVKKEYSLQSTQTEVFLIPRYHFSDCIPPLKSSQDFYIRLHHKLYMFYPK